MPRTFLSSVRRAFSKMSHSRMASKDYPSFPFLFPADYRNYAVEEWLQELEAVSFGSADIDVSVVSITQLKLKTRQAHEKSLIKLKVVPRPHSNRPINTPSPAPFNTYITTERGADIDNDDHGSCSSFLPDDKECDSCALHQLVSSDLNAIDRVTIPGRHNRGTPEEYIQKRQHNYTLLCCITVNDPMSLSQLAVLLTTIHNISIRYDPLRCNCYWYNYTLGEVIVREFGGLVSSDEHVGNRGMFMGTNIMKVDSVEEVRQNFHQAWKDMENRLVNRQSTRQAAISENAQLHQQLETERTERQQAESQRQQAESQRQQAESQRQQAESQRQQAESQRQQAESQRQQAERDWQQQLEAERTKREQVERELEREREEAMKEISRLRDLLSATRLSEPKR